MFTLAFGILAFIGLICILQGQGVVGLSLLALVVGLRIWMTVYGVRNRSV